MIHYACMGDGYDLRDGEQCVQSMQQDLLDEGTKNCKQIEWVDLDSFAVKVKGYA